MRGIVIIFHQIYRFNIIIDPNRVLYRPAENFLQGVIAHELGHAMGLADRTDVNSIMRASSVHAGTYRPLPVDINAARTSWQIW